MLGRRLLVAGLDHHAAAEAEQVGAARRSRRRRRSRRDPAPGRGRSRSRSHRAGRCSALGKPGGAVLSKPASNALLELRRAKPRAGRRSRRPRTRATSLTGRSETRSLGLRRVGRRRGGAARLERVVGDGAPEADRALAVLGDLVLELLELLAGQLARALDQVDHRLRVGVGGEDAVRRGRRRAPSSPRSRRRANRRAPASMASSKPCSVPMIRKSPSMPIAAPSERT